MILISSVKKWGVGSSSEEAKRAVFHKSTTEIERLNNFVADLPSAVLESTHSYNIDTIYTQNLFICILNLSEIKPKINKKNLTNTIVISTFWLQFDVVPNDITFKTCQRQPTAGLKCQLTGK